MNTPKTPDSPQGIPYPGTDLESPAPVVPVQNNDRTGQEQVPPSADDKANSEIDAYMQRLLDRLKQGPGSSGASTITYPPRSTNQPSSPTTSATNSPPPAAGGSWSSMASPSSASSGSRGTPPTAPGGNSTSPTGASAAAVDGSGLSAAPQPASPALGGQTTSSGRQTPPPVGTVAQSESRRSPPPETVRDLSAMRELANRSAQHALTDYRSRQRRERAFGKFSVALVAAVAAVALWYMPGSHTSPLRWAFYGAAAICILWATHFGLLLWYSFLRNRRLARSRQELLES